MVLHKQTFTRGTFILTVSSFFTRVLGFVNGILLARFLGAEGVGLLMIAHPLLPLFITLTELGLPVAISKLVSEAEAQKNTARVRRILVVSLTVTGTLSIVLTLFALFASKWIASVFLADQRAYYAMVAITPIIPIIAMSAVLKGYFRGKQNMNPLALSDIIENVVQIVVIIGVVNWLLPYGIAYAAAGAMAAVVIGEGFGLFYLFAMFKWSGRGRQQNVIADAAQPLSKQGDRTLFDLLRIGLPMTGSGFIHSIYRAFLPMLITKSLVLYGVSTEMATKQFGLLAGYVIPLLLLPGFFTQSLSTALIPAISEASVDSNLRLIHSRMDVAMRMALIVGLPCTIILFLWAEPLVTVIYHAPEAGILLKLIAPMFLLYYFEAPLQAILLGLGKASTVMWNHVLTNIFEVIAIFALGSRFGIEGVAWGFGFGICMLTLLNFLSVSSSIGFYFDFRIVLKAGAGVIVMTICGMATYSILTRYGLGQTIEVLGAVLVSLLTYVAMLHVTHVLSIRPKPPALTPIP
ncbi:stage V sporulation protein B [Paenibacillus eucommiae]|uniref:Stage V sporulation protein B n=1 Tax=Paenibacillus eucommiae TaxID=1355755 RepID=A0ABS4J508_9BACL|nr:stage V sporulation protein B [Paenibacillus eucommiae]MBP1993884.1 stage V sporulation protein B [Paenibacillus eucommiae]